jgi:hypothetical protein
MIELSAPEQDHLPTTSPRPKRLKLLRGVSGCGPKGERKLRRRMAIYQRDDFCCQYCGQDLLADVDWQLLATIDHLVPQAHGGINDPDNLVASCWVCNQFKKQTPAHSVADGRLIVANRRAQFARYRAASLARFGVAFPREAPGRPPGLDPATVAKIVAGPAAILRDALEIVERLTGNDYPDREYDQA